VLTEPDFFSGSLDDLRQVRSTVALPVLRKDFVLDPVQVWEARAAGADAVLLIVAVLGEKRLRRCLETVEEAKLEALVEVHSSDEAVIAVRSGARIVGVNNRDLATFVTDIAVSERIRPLLGDDVVTVAESGIDGPVAAARMRAAAYDAVLVGEALVLASDPALLIGDLREVGS